MRPFITTFAITVFIAAALWWQQRGAIASLRTALVTPAAAAVDQVKPAITPKPKQQKMLPVSGLRHADGSEVVTARSMFRGALEMADYMRGLSRTELEALIKSAVLESGNDMMEPSLFALARLAEFDPLAALKHAGALARTKEDSSAFSLIMHDWLIRDRAAALKWFHAQPDTNAKAGFMGVAGMVLGQSDPELLKQLSGSIADPDLQEDALAQSIMSQGMSDPDAAMARLQELPNDDAREQLLRQLMMMHGDKKARELLELSLPLAAQRKGMQQQSAQLLGQMAAGDPRAALEWMGSRPEKDIALLSEATVGMNLASLGKLDTATVLAAAKAFPPAQQDWLMANHYAGRPLDDPPALLHELTTGISDAKVRAEALQHVMDRCLRDGREAQLEPWIAAQPAAAQTALRAQVAKMKR